MKLADNTAFCFPGGSEEAAGSLDVRSQPPST